ncbi:MAG: hypothetical protein KJ893_08700 [Candidatus Omnitrophica bacterium]|nr:hypothetical protein [Candidatus Omnitrophota bacterium]MBU4479721.1 hypothetical protein [Candidatus Omnitrophota bacterium]MCG2703222.1 hypothetical protein [Candidatus Omnitrophota bacterium]
MFCQADGVAATDANLSGKETGAVSAFSSIFLKSALPVFKAGESTPVPAYRGQYAASGRMHTCAKAGPFQTEKMTSKNNTCFFITLILKIKKSIPYKIIPRYKPGGMRKTSALRKKLLAYGWEFGDNCMCFKKEGIDRL